jgi:hypothetical protein
LVDGKISFAYSKLQFIAVEIKYSMLKCAKEKREQEKDEKKLPVGRASPFFENP